MLTLNKLNRSIIDLCSLPLKSGILEIIHKTQKSFKILNQSNCLQAQTPSKVRSGKGIRFISC
jgi:hypothetical protein